MKAKLKDALKVAMKAKNQTHLDTIRSLLSAIQYEEDSQNTDTLPETTLMEIFKREIKKRREELDFNEKAARPDAVTKLKEEISVIEQFLPQQLSAAELEKIITNLKAANPAANMGIVMKSLKDGYAGKFDSKMASEIAKRIAG